MKKVTIFATLAVAVMTVACSGSNVFTKGNTSKIDTLSYLNGLQFYGMVFGIQDAAKQYNMDMVSEGLAAMSGKDMKKDTAYFRQYSEKYREWAQQLPQPTPEDTAFVLTLFRDDAMRDEMSKVVGILIGADLKTRANEDMPVQTYWVVEAFKDMTNNGEPRLSESELQNFQMRFGQQMEVREKKKRDENLVNSRKWLAKAAKQKGVQMTPDSIVYRVVEQGSDDVVTDDRDVVTVHYTGKNTKDKVFDSSYFKYMPEDKQNWLKQNNPNFQEEPISFPVNGVIRGWTEGIKLVGKGGKIELWIPAHLAYGEYGRSELIPGNEALYFEIELLNIEHYQEPAPIEEVE